MKKTLLIMACILVSAQVFSQDRKGFIGISLGGAIPVGAFSESSGTYNTAGYATTGASFNINFNYRLNDWIGLSISSVGAANSINAEKLISSNISASGLSYSIDKASSMSCFLIGGMIKKQSFPLYGKIQIGYGSVKTAELTLSDFTTSATFKQSDPAYGFAYNLGVGALFSLSNRWALTASIDYVSCLGKPSITLVDNSTGDKSYSPTFDYGQNYIGAQIGIGYMFQ
jgi:opacity protein-like surface antigen